VERPPAAQRLHRPRAGQAVAYAYAEQRREARAPVGLLCIPAQSKGGARVGPARAQEVGTRALATMDAASARTRSSGFAAGSSGTVYTEMSSGARSGGQTTARSFASPRDPVPVLSPTRHPDGRPARIRASPVVAPRSPAGRWSSAPVGLATRVGSAAVEDGGGGEHLERRAHREPLIGPVAHRRAAAGVQREHPDPPGPPAPPAPPGGPDQVAPGGVRSVAQPATARDAEPRQPSSSARRASRPVTAQFHR
jgi:hypothetical protein